MRNARCNLYHDDDDDDANYMRMYIDRKRNIAGGCSEIDFVYFDADNRYYYVVLYVVNVEDEILVQKSFDYF